MAGKHGVANSHDSSKRCSITLLLWNMQKAERVREDQFLEEQPSGNGHRGDCFKRQIHTVYRGRHEPLRATSTARSCSRSCSQGSMLTCTHPRQCESVRTKTTCYICTCIHGSVWVRFKPCVHGGFILRIQGPISSRTEAHSCYSLTGQSTPCNKRSLTSVHPYLHDFEARNRLRRTPNGVDA